VDSREYVLDRRSGVLDNVKGPSDHVTLRSGPREGLPRARAGMHGAANALPKDRETVSDALKGRLRPATGVRGDQRGPSRPSQ